MRKNLGLQFAYEIFAGLYLVSVVVFFWRYPFATGLLLGVGLGIWLWRWGDKADAAAMLAAALLGTPSEIVCVKYGVWTYRAPGLIMGIPLWIPLIWASLFCLFRRTSMTFHAISHRIWLGQTPTSRKIAFGFLAALIAAYYLLVAVTIIRSIAVVYTIFTLVAVIFWHEERDIIIFIVGGVIGTVGEYICMDLGFWQYLYPYFRDTGLPISLPMAWGLSAVIVARIAGILETDRNTLE